MTEATHRFSLPLIIPGQAQKELFHNEALTRVDMALQPSVEDGPMDAPPAAPEPGRSWLVGTAPEGAWEEQANTLAMWTEGGWRFVVPPVGMSVWSEAAGYALRWDGADWVDGFPVASIEIGGLQVVGSRQAAIASPSGGTVIDVEARAAIAAVLAALMSHGLIE